MRLFNKTIDRQLFKQYSLGSDLSKQEVVAKIFNPFGSGTWFILNSDPQDPDYLWAIVDLGYGAEVGSVSRTDLETYRGRFGMGFERDLSFDPVNALELYNGLRQGKYYADGGDIQENKHNIFFFYNENGDEQTFLTLEEATKEAKKQGQQKVRDNLGGEYFINYADGGEISSKLQVLFEKMKNSLSSKNFNYFDKLSNEVHEISDTKGLTEKEYEAWDSLREKQNELRMTAFLGKSKFADGGDIADFSDNQLMVMNQNVEVEHHHEELEDILKDKTPVPAWVVAKMETATQNLSDITHYLDGEKELMEDENEDENEEEDEDQDEIENKIVVEPINVSAGTKAELTKKFTDDAMGNLRGFLKGMEGIDLRDDYTFDYKDEQYEVEPIINSDENGVSNAVFTIFDGDGEEVGDVSYSRDGGKQKFTANSEFFSWNNAKFEDGGFMNNVYADGGVFDSIFPSGTEVVSGIYRTNVGIMAITDVKNINGYDWHIVTKLPNYEGGLYSFAYAGKFNAGKLIPFYNYLYTTTKDPMITLYEDKLRPIRNSEKKVEKQHLLALEIFKEKMKKGKFEDGGYFDGTIPKVSTYMSTYAKGGKLNNYDRNTVREDMENFSKIAKLSKDGNDFIERARKIKNISPVTSQWFFERYDSMSMKQASDNFVKDVKSGNFDIDEIYAKGGSMNKHFWSWKYAPNDNSFKSVIIYKTDIDDENSYDSVEQIKEQLTKEGVNKFIEEDLKHFWSWKYAPNDNSFKSVIIYKTDIDDENSYDSVEQIKEQLVKEGVTKFIEEDEENYAKGGEVAKAEIIGLSKNIMGTTSIEMKISGMRKSQDFSVYPIAKDDTDKIITIQSETRIGKIDLATGRGLMSQSHSNGAYFVHFQMDKLTPFTINEKDLKDLTSHIYRTAGDNVGSRGIFSDNSGASGVYAKGGMVVTSVKDIPNFKERLEQRRITYRGLGTGKLADDFYDLAGTSGTRIKVDGKEYFITDEEFNTFSRGADGNMKIRFEAPARKGYADGGNVEKPLTRFRVGESFRYKNNGSIIYTVTKVYNDGACEARDEEGDNYSFEFDELNELVKAENNYADGGFMNDVYAKGGEVKDENGFNLYKKLDDTVKKDFWVWEYEKPSDVIQGNSDRETEEGYTEKRIVDYLIARMQRGYIYAFHIQGVKGDDFNFVSETWQDAWDKYDNDDYEDIDDEEDDNVSSFGIPFDDDSYAKGGNIKKYILKADIKTVTVKRNGKEVTYKGADVLNGAHVLAKGGDITSKANYVGKNDIVEVELKDGSKVKPANGYWVKKGAEPIASKQEFTSKDLPKDGSPIRITAPAISGAPAIDLTLLYDSKNFIFDVYKDGRKKDKIGEKEVLNNLNSGIYVFTDKLTPTASGKSETKFGETVTKKGIWGWDATTNVNDFNNYDWRITTFRGSSGKLISSAKGGKYEKGNGYTTFKYTMYDDPYHTLEVSQPSRLTEKVVTEQHEKALAKFKKFMETGTFGRGGKISKFDKLSDKVAKEYEGKPVKSQYQEEYGKYYSKAEAQEVGDKVAGKVKAMQMTKK